MMIHSSRTFLLIAVVLAIAASALFVPGLDGGFVFDDRPNIVFNSALHVTRFNFEDLLYAAYSFQPGNGSRALPMLSFALDHLRGGLDARVFKETNLFIHAASTFALFMFLRVLLAQVRWKFQQRAAEFALIGALIWAIHPLQVSSVLYVVQRMQTLCNLFVILALWAYVVMRKVQCEGGRSRLYVVLMGLFWVVAMACKEDAILVPAYTFVIELAVFRFAAVRQSIASFWRWSYMLLALCGVFVFIFFAIPHYWTSVAYPGRDFSSFERLMTQGRVLMMYLQQIIIPLPDSMPFYYDDFSVSRGWMNPSTTLFSWLALAALVTWAVSWLRRRPLFSLGILFFFAGHFLTSNILNLELAFEHRNQIPMIGIFLAALDLSTFLFGKMRYARSLSASVTLVAIIGALTLATLQRSYMWGEPLRFAQKSVEVAPLSGRAWMVLGSAYAERSGLDPSSPLLQKAISTSEAGVERTGSVPLIANVITFKGIAGQDNTGEWRLFIERLRTAPMSVENVNTLWVMLGNAERGRDVDQARLLEMIEIIGARKALATGEYLRIGAYIHNETLHPYKALPYLKAAVASSEPGDPDITKMIRELKEAGRQDWVIQLSEVRPEGRPGVGLLVLSQQ